MEDLIANRTCFVPGEKIIFSTRSSIFVLIIKLIGLIIVGLILTFSFGALNISGEITNRILAFVINISPLIAVVLVSVIIFFDWYNKIYLLTTKRVEINYGILTTSEMSVDHNHIESVEYSQTLIGKIFNYGDIKVRTATGAVDLTFIAINNPRDRANQIEDRIRAMMLKNINKE